MIAVPFVIYGLSILILRQENKFTWAPSVLDKPVNYNSQLVWWSFVPRMMAWGSAAWACYLLHDLVSVVIPIAMVALYDGLNRVFTRVFLLASIEKKHLPFLHGMLQAHEGNPLKDEAIAEMTAVAKVWALQEILRSNGTPATPRAMQRLLRRLGYPREWVNHVMYFDGD